MAQVTQDDTIDTKAEGNTKPLLDDKKRARKWCFTLNNYEQKDVDDIIFQMTQGHQYIIGKEIGENKTPHLQGYLEFKNARSFKSIKKMIPRAHIEKAKGTSRQNYDYCSKDGDWTSNMDFRTFQEKVKEELIKKYDDCKWKPWQQQVIDILETKADERTIHWFWDSEGKTGKTFLSKYLALTRSLIIADGKKNDVFNQVNTMMQAEKLPEIIILDIPRCSIGYINYSIIEKLKDGLIYSGKYEGGICIFPNPHVIIFANTPPIVEQLSQDRWNIIEICNKNSKSRDGEHP